MMAAMVVCPVCENQQAVGEECQVCGARLTGPGVVPLPVEPLAGLEATRFDAVPAPPAAALPDLEPTHLSPAAAATAPTPDLEPTRVAPVRVPVEPLPELERTEGEPIPGDAPTARPAALLCRYCRTENPPSEIICGRCGMKLPVWEGPAAATAPVGEAVPARCPACGTFNAGEICSGCGSLVRRS